MAEVEVLGGLLNPESSEEGGVLYVEAKGDRQSPNANPPYIDPGRHATSITIWNFAAFYME